MEDKKWYKSRKLWYALGTVVALVSIGYGGPHMGLSSSSVSTLLYLIFSAGFLLITGHTLTDIRLTPAVLQGIAAQGRVDRLLELLPQLLEPLPQLLKLLLPVSGDGPEVPAEEVPEVPTEEVPEEVPDEVA